MSESRYHEMQFWRFLRDAMEAIQAVDNEADSYKRLQSKMSERARRENNHVLAEAEAELHSRRQAIAKYSAELQQQLETNNKCLADLAALGDLIDLARRKTLNS